MKILAIDYGTKRIGLAVSDESQTLARELSIVSPKEFAESIGRVIQENEIGEIVVGLPLNMSGEDSEKTREVRIFAENLKSYNVPVTLVDERLSSTMAQRAAGANKNIDSLAAQIILQNHLDRIKNKK